MGGCRVPGPTCRERATGTAQAPGTRVADSNARPAGASAAASTGPTLTGWPREIAWGEFREIQRRPTGENEDAQISSSLEQPEQVHVTRSGGRFRLDAYEAVLSVVEDESWVVTSAKSDTLLAHEQGHYDITGLVARDMIRDLRGLRAASTAALGREVQAIIRRADALADRLTILYDEQTNHGRNRAKQEKWEQLLRTSIQNSTRLSGGPR
jgi:hypothetical protein